MQYQKLSVKNTKNNAVRWTIKADGMIVGHEYNSEGKAWSWAYSYADHCANQDIPYFPKMTVEKETIT